LVRPPDNSLGDPKYPVMPTTTSEEMAAYDKLPKALRWQLSQAPLDWSSVQTAEFAKIYGAKNVAAHLAAQSAEVMARELENVRD